MEFDPNLKRLIRFLGNYAPGASASIGPIHKRFKEERDWCGIILQGDLDLFLELHQIMNGGEDSNPRLSCVRINLATLKARAIDGYQPIERIDKRFQRYRISFEELDVELLYPTRK